MQTFFEFESIFFLKSNILFNQKNETFSENFKHPYNKFRFMKKLFLSYSQSRFLFDIKSQTS